MTFVIRRQEKYDKIITIIDNDIYDIRYIYMQRYLADDENYVQKMNRRIGEVRGNCVGINN